VGLLLNNTNDSRSSGSAVGRLTFSELNLNSLLSLVLIAASIKLVFKYLNPFFLNKLSFINTGGKKTQ